MRVISFVVYIYSSRQIETYSAYVYLKSCVYIYIIGGDQCELGLVHLRRGALDGLQEMIEVYKGFILEVEFRLYTNLCLCVLNCFLITFV